MAERSQHTDEPDDGQDNLFEPMDATTYRVDGDFGDQSKPMSLYSRYVGLHPNRRRLLTGALLLGAAAMVVQAARRTGNGNGNGRLHLNREALTQPVAALRDTAKNRLRQYRRRKALTGRMPFAKRLRLLFA